MTNIQTAAQIIMTTALEALAKVHGCSVAQVAEGLKAGNAKLAKQFQALAQKGVEAAAELATAGRIVL